MAGSLNQPATGPIHLWVISPDFCDPAYGLQYVVLRHVLVGQILVTDLT
jgi:hypothetical protein